MLINKPLLSHFPVKTRKTFPFVIMRRQPDIPPAAAANKLCPIFTQSRVCTEFGSSPESPVPSQRRQRSTPPTDLHPPRGSGSAYPGARQAFQSSLALPLPPGRHHVPSGSHHHTAPAHRLRILTSPPVHCIFSALWVTVQENFPLFQSQNFLHSKTPRKPLFSGRFVCNHYNLDSLFLANLLSFRRPSSNPQFHLHVGCALDLPLHLLHSVEDLLINNPLMDILYPVHLLLPRVLYLLSH